MLHNVTGMSLRSHFTLTLTLERVLTSPAVVSETFASRAAKTGRSECRRRSAGGGPVRRCASPPRLGEARLARDRSSRSPAAGRTLRSSRAAIFVRHLPASSPASAFVGKPVK